MQIKTTKYQQKSTYYKSPRSNQKKQILNLRPPPLTGASSAWTWLEDDKTELRYPILLLESTNRPPCISSIKLRKGITATTAIGTKI